MCCAVFYDFVMFVLLVWDKKKMVLLKTLHCMEKGYSRSNNLDTCGVQYFAGMSIFFCNLQHNRVVRDLCKAHNA